MRTTIMLATLAALAASGCDNRQTSAPPPKIAVRSEAQNQLHKLDELNRAIGLKRAILDSGRTCRRVTRSGYVQEYQNLSMWTANCDEKIDYAIFVGPDGSAQVRYCSEMQRFGLPACVIRKEQDKPAPTAPAAG